MKHTESKHEPTIVINTRKGIVRCYAALKITPAIKTKDDMYLFEASDLVKGAIGFEFIFRHKKDAKKYLEKLCGKNTNIDKWIMEIWLPFDDAELTGAGKKQRRKDWKNANKTTRK